MYGRSKTHQRSCLQRDTRNGAEGFLKDRNAFGRPLKAAGICQLFSEKGLHARCCGKAHRYRNGISE